MKEETTSAGKDFIRQIIDADLESGKCSDGIITRFPPEPNGYLHIGHAKSMCLNFGIAAEYSGSCILRFDDTNPVKEDQKFVDSIIKDIRWLGFDSESRLTHASDYFEKFYDCAITLIEHGKAYVDSLSAEEIRELRGTLTEPGKPSPYRERSVAENLDLFARMKAGEFADGEHILRAKIDMASPNINLRDPAIYRIRKITHQRTGDSWCIYPMYDFAHATTDALESITHSLCTLEFEDHRPLYDWVIKNLDLPSEPNQYEFSRLNLAYTITSKRKLATLVEEQKVVGWDDPRMPTIAGMRRRGYPAPAIRDFCGRIGITKKENIIEMGVLENSVREHLNPIAHRVLAVLNPLKVVITNYPEGQEEMLVADNHPMDPEAGQRELPFSREIYVEQNDFMEEAPRKFFRLKPGGEVRLRYAYIIRCDEVIKNAAGEVIELHCSYDPATKSGMPDANRKVKGTIHWVSCDKSLPAEVRLYDRLFSVARPGSGDTDFLEHLNPGSLEVLHGARVEPSVKGISTDVPLQFERNGYFVADSENSSPEQLVINRVITLRDSWLKQEKADRA
ncbi:MAG: glutamine--tRNA ligase/YqeY domain fusion protein [Chromatiales bacterium]|jgi:glutaminyl-tRNA synthetase|nr:glutamine--tRNA ligase/YqeY domain fusion protein [Chromatiales bacterium]